MASKIALNFSPLVRGRVHLLARHLLARTRSHVLVPFSPADAVPLWCVVFCGVPGHTHLTGLCRLVEPLRCMSHGQIVEYPYVHSSYSSNEELGWEDDDLLFLPLRTEWSLIQKTFESLTWSL